MSSPGNIESGSFKQGFAGGTTIAVAALLFVAGLLGLAQGISAVANDELIVAGPQYTYEFDLTTWGWIHIIVGILGMIVALGLFSGAVWARATAIVVASLAIIANFLWLPYYPWWSILLIAINLLVIWSLATWDAR
ncbi:hypothetical protein [Gordonia sp. (in: high G+C Gram-positive bacteria)]|uniref:DUF7144 family membrane protein n=1 Tax=Gordonia sp. (in: high G+C Gram-positive bacteria) TaxID=84139 RepID=UPI0016A2091A|nr:hypothetical protein [Gordonia sp. (in: high G+C Gram-positive bacteria)]NLG46269.1 hypothetical protein [Gordonia sp. (in: high G+C Gram-positive bacteria)]